MARPPLTSRQGSLSHEPRLAESRRAVIQPYAAELSTDQSSLNGRLKWTGSIGYCTRVHCSSDPALLECRRQGAQSTVSLPRRLCLGVSAVTERIETIGAGCPTGNDSDQGEALRFW